VASGLAADEMEETRSRTRDGAVSINEGTRRHGRLGRPVRPVPGRESGVGDRAAAAIVHENAAAWRDGQRRGSLHRRNWARDL